MEYEGINEFCGLTVEELAAVSPNLLKLASARLDVDTLIFYNPTRKTAAEALLPFIKHNESIKSNNYGNTQKKTLEDDQDGFSV